MRQSRGPIAVLAIIAALTCVPAESVRAETGQRSFSNGLPTDPGFFPIAVWLQQPYNAGKFAAIGINTFGGLWRPPEPTGLAQLRSHGIYLILEQTAEALALKDNTTIRGWLQTDEPDNAQSDGQGGYGDCISPEEIVRRYDEMRSHDSTRPVYLGFGQAVANPKWIGRGTKCAAIAPEVYYKAASRGADIVAFDIYPIAETDQAHVMGRLDLVGRGVRNLKSWAPPGVPVWADIETTHIKNPYRRPTPEEIRSEVWMAIINGATGINYFVHEWEPSFNEDGVFQYPDVVAGLKKLNGQIRDLAPVLNSPTIEGAVKINSPGELAYMVKQDAATTYLFAVNMGEEPVSAKMAMAADSAPKAVVVGEDRAIDVEGGAFEDSFQRYQVHIYELRK